MAYGRYFEEFTVGEVIKHWPGRTIGEADCTWFALLTMNQHPLHSDAHYAATHTQHGQRVVLGPLVFSIGIGMTVADVSGKAIANLEIEKIVHLAPTFIGDTIYSESSVLAKRESRQGDRGIVSVQTRVSKFVNEKTGKMSTMKTPAVILEGVWCQSRYSNCRLFCPRSIYTWWREVWLERASEPAAVDKELSDVTH